LSEFSIGLISCGNMGKSLAQQAVTIDGARLACCCDIDADKAQAAASQFASDFCTSNDELFARDDIDGVIIAAPNFLHKDITVAASQAGKHVLCEKPMALSKADCQAMIDATNAAGVKLMIGQVLRYNPPYVWIDELFKSGEMGEPFSMQVTRQGGGWTGGTYDAPWRRKKETCGGPLYEINQHEIDFMRCIMGNVASVAALTGNFVSQDEFDYEDTATVLMGFESGGQGCLLGGHSALLGRYDGKIYATKGTLYFSAATGQVEYVIKGQEAKTVPNSEITGYEAGVRREVREWMEACLNNTEPPIPGEEGRANVEIAEAADISAREGRIVQLPM